MKVCFFQIPIGASLSLFSGIVSVQLLDMHRNTLSSGLFCIVVFGLSFLLLIRGVTNMIYAKKEIINVRPYQANKES